MAARLRESARQINQARAWDLQLVGRPQARCGQRPQRPSAIRHCSSIDPALTPAISSRDANESAHGLAAQHRHSSPDRGHSRRPSSAARAVRRSARPRALPFHAIAARPLHAAEPAGQAALALGLRRAPRMAGKAAIAANAGLLTVGTGGAPATPRRQPPQRRPGAKHAPCTLRSGLLSSIHRQGNGAHHGQRTQRKCRSARR